MSCEGGCVVGSGGGEGGIIQKNRKKSRFIKKKSENFLPKTNFLEFFVNFKGKSSFLRQKFDFLEKFE